MNDSWRWLIYGIAFVASLLVISRFVSGRGLGSLRRLFYIREDGEYGTVMLDTYDQVQFLPRDRDTPLDLELHRVAGHGTIIVHRRHVSASGSEVRHSSDPPIAVRHAELLGA